MVRYAGAGQGAIPITLIQWNAATGEELYIRQVASSSTGVIGRYVFTNAPTLEGTYRYYIWYFNQSSSSYLSFWSGPVIEAYTAGQTVYGGDFDIADLKLSSPAHGATVTLPVTFTWQRRTVAGDTYRHILFDPDSDAWWWTDDLGYVGQFTAADLPPEIVYGKTYGWTVRIFNGPNSYGDPFYTRAIIFAQGAQAAAGPERRAPLFQRGDPALRGALNRSLH